MSIRPLLLAAFALATLTGCNPSGTCLTEVVIAGDPRGATCEVNKGKLSCSEMGPNFKAEFFAEDNAAGMIRCKSRGYDDVRGQPPVSDANGHHTFFKKVAAVEPKPN